MRALHGALVAAILLVCTTDAHASGIVRASSGATARVNPAHAHRFQCLVNGLEAVGYRIQFMGGYR